jgi:radical SAM protein with 4Fe4S-binding SPASM domain
MQYFMLNPECYFVKGARRAALYNLHTGNVFSVGPTLTALLSACEIERKPVSAALTCTNIPEDEALKALNELRKERLGRFYETQKNPPIIEKVKPAVSRRQRIGGPKLDELSVELTGECNLNCVFCEGQTFEVRRAYGCARWPCRNNGHSRLMLENWEEVVSDGEKLGCRKLCFFGGEPMLAWADLCRLVQFARETGYKEIRVETNGCLLDEDRIAFLKQQDVSVRVQLLSFQERVHDQITQVPGSFRALMKNLQTMMEQKVRYAFLVLIMDRNADHLRETVEWFDGYEPQQCVVDVLYPRRGGGREHVSPIHLPVLYRTAQRPFATITAQEFFKRAEYHPCFHGQIAVTAYGEILPCPMAREEVLGNIHTKSLTAVFRDRDMYKYWLLTKDGVEVCRDCEYRYACFDCRPLERSLCAHLNGRSELCAYDPYRGEWMDAVTMTSQVGRADASGESARSTVTADTWLGKATETRH